MIPNGALLNKLRALNFEFKRQADRLMIYKQGGTTKRVSLRRNASHDIDYAKTVLHQAGMSDDDIEVFVMEYRRLH